MVQELPWNHQDYFLDEIDEYPMFDYFPLTGDTSQPETTNESQNTGVY